ncbi:tail fiber protein [Dryocola sp. LX212]
MAVKYKTLITTAGAAKFAAATAGGTKITLTQMAVGDGGGSLPVPDVGQTKLISEQWRAPLNKISVDAKHKNYVVAELLIPPEVGGFWMREMGLYDADGTLVAVANMAESYKPELAEGSGRAQTLRMVIIISEIESVGLTIDTTTVMATQDYVDDRLAEHEKSRRHPDATLKEKGFTQLSSATNSDSETLAATPKAVKAAYDLANGKYSAQDATTARKGIVQLSSATNSTSEALAATPKAVKAAYDLANGKYSAQDATTARKGIVQLSSATDSTSEALAATPKAVKAANDNANGRVPSGRKINGKALSVDVNITSQDIFGTQATGIGSGADLNTFTTPGLYYQPANAQAITGKNYPEAVAGSLEVYKHAGFTQVYRIYSNARCYIRTFYAEVWSAWAKVYDTSNRPTAADVGALSVNGGTVNGEVKIKATNGLRIYNDDYGIIFRRSENNLHIIPTAKGAGANGDIGPLRPLSISLDTGKVNFSHGISASSVGVGDWTNFDARYQAKGNYTPAGQAYTKTESDGRFIIADAVSYAGFVSNNAAAPYMRHKASNTVVSLATKTYAYSQSESNARFVTGVRFGASAEYNERGNKERMAGGVMTAFADRGSSNYWIRLRPLQYLLNGAWVTAAYA